MITIHNRLHKGTACLVLAVLNMAAERGTPYVTYRQAAKALLAARTGHVDGGSFQRRGAARLVWCSVTTPLERLRNRTTLRTLLEGRQS